MLNLLKEEMSSLPLYDKKNQMFVCVHVLRGKQERAKDEYRGKGLGLAVASSLILECLEKNIYPRWGAANLESLALLAKLGYYFDREYKVYSIS